MARKRKSHAASFKAQVALAALKGDKTINELAKQFAIHPTLIHGWKKQCEAGVEEVFSRASDRLDRGPPGHAGPVATSRSAGSRWTWSCSKKNSLMSVDARRGLVDPEYQEPSVARQCMLLDLPGRATTTSLARRRPENLKLIADRQGVHGPPGEGQSADGGPVARQQSPPLFHPAARNTL